jgi:TPR repeat protein
LKTAAAGGDAQAQSDLGLMYAHGTGVGRDYAQALHWYRAAVAQGDPGAEDNLGVMYAQGWGVARDDARGRGAVPDGGGPRPAPGL